jgi:hypothetical protein
MSATSPRRARRPVVGKNFDLRPIISALGGSMKHWTASVAAILLAGFPVVAGAQVNCEAIPHGPARRLLPWPKSVLSGTIGSCRCQSARAIRRRVVSGNYRNRPSETQAKSAALVGRASLHRAYAPRVDRPGTTFKLSARRMKLPHSSGSAASSWQ